MMKKVGMCMFGSWTVALIVTLVGFLFNACSGTTGTIGDPPVEANLSPSASVDPQTSKLVVELRPTIGKSTSLGLSGQTVLLATYDVRNDGAFDDAVTTFTVMPAKKRVAFSRLGYAWDEKPDALVEMKNVDEDGSATFTPTKAAAKLSKGSTRALRVIGEIANVDAVVNPEHGAYSGDAESIEMVSLKGLDAAEAALREPTYGTPYLLHHSAPSLVAHPLPVVPPQLGESYLMSWGVRADAAGDVTVKQFGLSFNLANIKLCDFQLRRGTRLMEPHEFLVVESTSTSLTSDLKEGCVNESTDIAVIFTKEELVRAGTETVLSLRARVTAINDGAFVMTSFHELGDARTSVLLCGSNRILGLGTATGLPGILWSDLSSHPHTDTSCGSTPDWIGDAMIPGIGMVQYLK